MTFSDRELGMRRRISRRDVLHGLGAIAASTLVPGKALADAVLASEVSGSGSGYYPPALTGLRGSHKGSFEVAHAVAREGRRDWGPVGESDTGVYDLIVVGAGISGLSAAYFYRQQNPGARVLLLDNHDDFGGHAKRNEFSVGEQTVLGYGGSQTLEEPSSYPEVARTLLRDLGIDLSRFDKAYDSEFYRRHGLRAGVFFNREDWGSDTTIPYDLGALGGYLPLAPSELSATQAVAKMPLSVQARKEMLALLTVEDNRLGSMPASQREGYLYSLSYQEFLKRHMGIESPEVIAALRDLAPDSGLGIESASAGSAILYSGMPGIGATGLPKEGYDEPYIHHFPDGNASVARLLVRGLIPAVAEESSMEDIVTARFDYDALDRAGNEVRMRLNSTVIDVRHSGTPGATQKVDVTYVHNGLAHRVRAGSCILACYSAVIPSLCAELPEKQRQALKAQVKSPILYTNVALKNWRAWEKLGIGATVAPGSYHVNAMLDFPVSLGKYRYTATPDDPVLVHMERFPHPIAPGLSRRDRFRAGRHELLSTPFETIEREVRRQLTGTLAGGGFDPARDIAGITVNRWAHGYSYDYDFQEEPYYPDWDDERYPHVIARKPFGRIAIANADAGAMAMLEVAVVQAHRAVSELN